MRRGSGLLHEESVGFLGQLPDADGALLTQGFNLANPFKVALSPGACEEILLPTLSEPCPAVRAATLARFSRAISYRYFADGISRTDRVTFGRSFSLESTHFAIKYVRIRKVSRRSIRLVFRCTFPNSTFQHLFVVFLCYCLTCSVRNSNNLANLIATFTYFKIEKL